ncbi:class I SAM-dependent methyltransferase [Micromonospora sp. NBS 11-29]|uniref:class I SAM-dependent methyltransferase n=1 Tax=Micromonospora sp. NBS 11-29 TaxID=1960879 RepID=UPI000B77925F|nr:class I SAM-dependent methyltransferase [Micromonospora sp. NBS 11-29]
MSASQVESFDAHYAGTPLWDLGRPQAAMRELAEAGAFRGRVLDVGCGTGELALLVAASGLPTVGVDAAPTAIRAARRKADERGLRVRFEVGDALDLGALGEQFDTVLDSCLFHAFDETDRIRYAASLAGVMPSGARLFLLCIGDRHQPGPVRAPHAGIRARRVSAEVIRDTFTTGWRIDSLESTTVENTRDSEGAPGWLATVTRV